MATFDTRAVLFKQASLSFNKNSTPACQAVSMAMAVAHVAILFELV
jgi:hypothetical protein